MDLGEVDILDVVGGIVVLDLAAGPVETFDLDDFVVGDFAACGDWFRLNEVMISMALGDYVRSIETVAVPSGCHRFCRISVSVRRQELYQIR